jgi:predicted amidohydrolase YtcJ
MTERLFRDVEVGGRRVDVRIRGGVVAEVGAGLPPTPGEDVVDGGGGALLPGLHDHHVHLLATAAARQSVDCSAGLDVLATAPGDGWIRGVGCTVSVDRYVLDRFQPVRPVRVQHASGGLWMLNSVALAAVAEALDSSPDVERDQGGEPTGRLWRYDERLRAALPPADQQDGLELLAADLLALGITSVTDATPDLDPAAVALLRRFRLPVTLLGDPSADTPLKLLLRDHDLPTYDELRARVLAARADGRPVAVHCVTRESLVLTVAVLDDVGRVPGDRIEHAAVVPDPRALQGLTVVTQPGFLHDRGDRYLAEVDPRDLPQLYPWASLSDAGALVLPSSDAPYGPLDPWFVIAAARDRRTSAGVVLGAAERVSTREALAGYLADRRGRPRRLAPGEPAGVVLLSVPLVEALADPSAEHVRQAYVAESAS